MSEDNFNNKNMNNSNTSRGFQTTRDTRENKMIETGKFAKVSKIKRDSLSSLIEDYIINRNNLIKIFVLIDCKIGIKNTDIDMFDKIGETNKKFSIILTKIDKCSINFVKNQSNSLVSLAKNYNKNFVEIFNVSSIKNLGIIDIQKKIFNLSKNNEI